MKRATVHQTQLDSYGYSIPAHLCQSCREGNRVCLGCNYPFTLSTAHDTQHFCSSTCEKTVNSRPVARGDSMDKKNERKFWVNRTKDRE